MNAARAAGRCESGAAPVATRPRHARRCRLRGVRATSNADDGTSADPRDRQLPTDPDLKPKTERERNPIS